MPEQPTPAHKWDNTAKEWVLSLVNKQNEIRGLRRPELDRTDKFMLSDFFAKFSEVEQSEITTYRQALRDAPDHSTIAECKMPVCPACIKE